MQFQDTLYPYELLSLLEALHREDFTGTVTLHGDEGRTQLYLIDGATRYATTTQIDGSFPAYLLTEGLFSRERVHRWLETCTDEETTLEAHLLGRRRLDPRGLVHLKEDLARQVLALAMCTTAAVELEPARRGQFDFGDVVLDPYQALFRCCAEHPVHGAMLDAFQGLWSKPLRRGPAFFVQFPDYRRFFPASPMPRLLDASPSLSDLLEEAQDEEATIAQVFAMVGGGMAFVQGESPRPAILKPESSPRGGEPTPRRRGADIPERPPRARFATRGRTTTAPGVRVTGAEGTGTLVDVEAEARGAEQGAGGEALGPGAAARPNRPGRTTATVISPPPPMDGEDRESWADRFADLHGGLVGEGLVDSARRAEGMDHYAFLGVAPDAPSSRIRAAWRRVGSRYREENFHGHYLPGEAGAALRKLQARCDEAYEALTDLRSRRAHDEEHAIEGALPVERLESLFYAEGVFKAAQIRMARQAWTEAIELLEEALDRAPDEPEYHAYLAWAVYGAGLDEEEQLPRDAPEPEDLLDEALALDPDLESAWLFRARMARHAGDEEEAGRAYFAVLGSNPDNAEARDAMEQLRAEGVDPEATARPGLAERLARMLRRR